MATMEVTAGDVTHNSVTLKISPPRFGAENIICYSLKYCVSGEDGWKQTTTAKAEEVTVSGLTPNTEYMFRCRAVTSIGFGSAGEVIIPIKTLPCSPPGKPQVETNSSEITVSWEKPAEIGQDVHILSYIVEYTKTGKGVKEDLQHNLIASSESINSGSPSLYKLPLEEEEEMNIDGCRRYNLGKKSMRQNRTIMLLGATGSGKSTLINGMINYIVGVEWKDDFRFKLVDEDQLKSEAESQTSEVTVYKINHQDGFQIPFSLTIVDTPDFEDASNIERDKIITEQLRNLFSATLGVSEIDAVCFVVPAALTQLTPSQKKVFDSVLSIFGKDVAENIRVLVTFADGQCPTVLEAINKAGVPCPKTKDGLPAHFKFNNSDLFADNKSSTAKTIDEDRCFDEMFWDMETRNMKRFFVALNVTDTKSLTMTKEVLRERKQLENFQKQIELGLAKLKEMKEREENLKERAANKCPYTNVVGPACEVNSLIKTLPCSPPGKPQSISWEKPAEIGQDIPILSHNIDYTQEDKVVIDDDLQWNQMMSRKEKVIISGLQSETEYAVRVRCDCGSAGRSKESITVNVCTTKCTRLTEILKRRSESRNSGSLSLYKLPLEEEELDIDGCRRYNFGKESMRQNHTIMLFGVTGSGKSTLINGMINYIVGVEWKDDFRFKLVDEDRMESQVESSEVTVYKINHQDGFKIPFSLTIVDTSGFGNIIDNERDKEITEQLHNLLSAEVISEVDAVCFVVPASLTQLTPSQKNVFDSVLSIFGKDVAGNIRVLVTSADGQNPPVLEAVNESDVPCPKTKDGLPAHFKFNHSALFADNKSSAANSTDGEEGDECFDQVCWNMGTEGMKRFFLAFNDIDTKSLNMTKEVLTERKNLDHSVKNLQKQVKIMVGKTEEIKETFNKLSEHEAKIRRNENFEFEVTITKFVKVDISGTGMNSTNCQQCRHTCHYPCIITYADERCCASMGSDGHCTVCPDKCHWYVHDNEKYRWDYKEVKEKQTVKQLKEKYLKGTAEKDTQTLIKKMREEKDLVSTELKRLIENSENWPNRLKEIALKPNPLSTQECIDMLIKAEKSEAKPGWHERVGFLMNMRVRGLFTPSCIAS